MRDKVSSRPYSEMSRAELEQALEEERREHYVDASWRSIVEPHSLNYPGQTIIACRYVKDGEILNDGIIFDRGWRSTIVRWLLKSGGGRS